jgi:DNA-binding NarL/FixJ family response regulator
MATAKLLITDDHEVVRQGVRTILKNRPQWEICGEAVNGKDAIDKAQKLRPDIIIMDITMPEMGGIEATREITRVNPSIAILVFTMHESSHLAQTVREAGARGIVLKSHAARDLVDALETLARGGSFFGPQSGGDPKESPKVETKDQQRQSFKTEPKPSARQMVREFAATFDHTLSPIGLRAFRLRVC